MPHAPFLSALHLQRDQVPSFETYPFNLPAVRALDTLPLHPAVTFFVGENGSGKSTLLEATAVNLGLNPEGGSKNFNFSTRASHSSLCDHLIVRGTSRRPKDCWFLRAESLFNLATEIERLDSEPMGAGRVIDSYGGRSLHEQSHGEAFFAVFRNRFGRGLYLLDEPEAALSPMRQMGFLSVMHDLIKSGSQFLIATHSPIIMAYPDSWTYVLGGPEIVRTPYAETEHYRITREFLNHPARSLQILMDRPSDNP
jgi:predicted ATPase